MRKHTLGIGISAFLLGPAGIVLASHGADAVSIGSVAVSGCGAQTLTVSGTASYATPVNHFVVTLDGAVVLHDHAEPESWSLGPRSMSVGSHTVTATIYAKAAIGGGHEDVEAQDTETFTVPECSTPSTGDTGAPASDGDGGAVAEANGENGDDGEDVNAAEKAVKKVGKVKGAAVKRLSANLKWINATFRKAYGRTPTFAEWSYWAHRLLTDKPKYDALYGAMQWHQLRGHTMEPGWQPR